MKKIFPELALPVLKEAREEMYEKYVETNEAVYSICKMLIDFEISRQEDLITGESPFVMKVEQPQPEYKKCATKECKRQAPQVGFHCGRCVKERKEKAKYKKEFNKKWGFN